jgi:hypothetical protein
MATATFMASEGCTLALTSRNLWFIAGPMMLFLVLIFYALATSLLVSLSNEITVAKFRLRRALFWLTLLVCFEKEFAFDNLECLGSLLRIACRISFV